MTSQINPNDIDGAYPVAGQDNDSQGFRTNFTNTQTNFQYAADEITDLQSKVLLKSALTGTSLNNNVNGQLLYNFKSQQVSATVNPLGTTSGSVTLNWALGSYQTLTTSGSIVLGFSNFPASGAEGSIVLQINVQNTAHTLQLPTAVTIGTANLQGYVPGTRIITFSTTGIYTFAFATVDGGATVSVVDFMRNRDPIYLPSSEDLAASAGANLAVTTSYFSTSAAETATLAAGANGQVKVLAAANVTAGNMVVTVSNAGWKCSGTGTATFSARGQACTLLYTDSKWFCIGNNGVTFA